MQISSSTYTGDETLMRLAVQRADTPCTTPPMQGLAEWINRSVSYTETTRSFYMKNRETELKPLFDQIDQSNMSQREKRRAKATQFRADGISDLILWVTTGLKRLTNLVIVKPVRRGIALVSKPAIKARKLCR